jgi:hypothetical protein
MPTLVTGLLNTDVMNFIECPECSQPAGICCMTYKGKKQSTPHRPRSEAYLKKFSDRAALYKDGPDRAQKIHLCNQKLLTVCASASIASPIYSESALH